MKARKRLFLALDHAVLAARDHVGSVTWPIQDELPDGARIGEVPAYEGRLTVRQRVLRVLEWVLCKTWGMLDTLWLWLPDVHEPQQPHMAPRTIGECDEAAKAPTYQVDAEGVAPVPVVYPRGVYH